MGILPDNVIEERAALLSDTVPADASEAPVTRGQIPTVPPMSKLWSLTQRGLALMTIIISSPVFLMLFIAVKLTSRGPFLYRQTRYGAGGLPFETLKVRTMTVGADKDQSRAIYVAAGDPEITRIGRLLRDLKLDELPQLWNVVRGDMALVGPRPIAPALQEQLEEKIPGFRLRLAVQPGLTSLAQICIIRNAEGAGMLRDWQMRFEAEMHYIANRSFAYDAIVIAMTVLYLIRRVFSETVIRRLGRAFQVSAATAACLLLVGCLGYGGEVETDGPLTRLQVTDNGPVALSGEPARDTKAAIQREAVRVEALAAGEPDPAYRVGPGDILSINVFDEPGLNQLLLRVDDRGQVQIPVLENFEVEGKTEVEIRDDLKEAFSDRFKDPWVLVQVAEYRSQPIYLLGEFNSPGVRYLERPTNIVQAVSLGNGIRESASLRGAQLRRDGRVLPIDVEALLRDGREEQNIWLQPGDTLFMPNASERQAYVLGAVEDPGAVSLARKPLTLLQAISQVGGPLTPAADMQQVRIIRAHSPLEGELLVVDADAILSGNMLDLPLQADDLVFVPKSDIGDWNDVVATILPSLQLVGATLQPFVQVRFLLDDD
ncbi:MAG: sugar transferase [Alphaproteobacteria bacterium]|nr:sugar transferase [Alphaproteobacteria bacterium SS10]